MPFGLISGLAGATVSFINNQQNLSAANQAQMQQQYWNQWNADRYIENRDYDRALQKQIFAREDTAVQRALDDYTNAGFSPLAAVGQNYDSGQAISSSQAPSITAPNYTSQALQANQNSFMNLFMQRLAAADKLKEIGATKEAQIQVDEAVHDLKMDEMEQEFYQDMQMLDQDQAGKEELARIMNDWNTESRDAEHKHQKEMADINHNNLIAQANNEWMNKVKYQSDMTDANARAWRNVGVQAMLDSKNRTIRALGYKILDAPNAEFEEYYRQLLVDYVASANQTAGSKLDAFNSTMSSITGAAGIVK